MTYCFDIDGTLCTNTEGTYESAEPFPDAIEEVNRLGREGHSIILYTARGSTTGIDWRGTTEQQLKAWGVRYDSLVLGKPTAHVYVDDKAINVVDWRRSLALKVDASEENE
jgi:hypothetical protein